MPQPSDEPSPSLFDRARALFDRTWEVSPAERAAFVQREANGDAKLVAEVMTMLAVATQDNAEQSQDAVRQWLDVHEPGYHDATAPESGPDRVQSTATSDLLAKLARAPKLDTDRYRLEGHIGQGGMGVVRRIHDQQLNRRLAMKVPLDRSPPTDDNERHLRHQLLGRFLEEAQVTSQLDHPGVVPVHELGLDQSGKVYFTMRLVKGRTAHEIFRLAKARREDWTTTRALEVILKVCDTMAYAHDKGVLHRDLKPGNVMVGSFGEVYVLDWGVAKVLDQPDRHDLRILPREPATDARIDMTQQRGAASDEVSPLVSLDGQKLGTPSYMSPEQARGELLDARADVYSIGAMLYDLLTGRVPYTVPGRRVDGYQILKDVVEGPPKRIEEIEQGVPAELVAIVDKAMARDREQRYVSATALAGDLRAFLGSQVVSAYRTGALVELQLWVRRNRPLAASLVAAVLILVAGIVGTTIYADEAKQQAKANKLLAAERTELAASATKAKDDALAQKQRADETAAANEKLANEKGRTVSNFNQLAGVVRLKDALARQDELWPAWPDKVAAMKEWLEKDCAQLLAMRPQIEATIADLQAKALPLTPAQVEVDRCAAPEWSLFERHQQLVVSLRRAQAIRSGASQLELPELPAALRNADAQALNLFAWPRIAPEKDGENPERTTFGEEAVALVAARAAVAKAAGKRDQFQFLDTLAWAALANGQDAEAKQRTAAALAKAPAAERDAYAACQRDIEGAIAQSKTRLAATERKLAELDTRVSARRTWTFGTDSESESARFLHDALVSVLAGVDAMAAKEKVDVEQRLVWAQQVRAASLEHPKAGATWAAVREAIAKADDVVASKLYAGISIPLPDETVIGLVPIGMNPVTKFWEFYELRSAWDGVLAATEIEIPTHKDDGSIDVKAGTGIVFVLLPGGTVMLGSQDTSKNAPYFDAERTDDESLHPVTLAPFMLARHEMTQGQWSRLLTWNATLRAPSRYNASSSNFVGKTIVGKTITLAHPVEQVSWDVCTMLLMRSALVLPTEAQWEYGCRGGTTSVWWLGSAVTDLAGNVNVLDKTAVEYATKWRDGNPAPFSDLHVVHAPVGSFVANRYGLYDVHGNVYEWCREQVSAYGGERGGDGARPDSADRREYRCLRGGSFHTSAADAKSANRDYRDPAAALNFVGLRPARLITH